MIHNEDNMKQSIEYQLTKIRKKTKNLEFSSAAANAVSCGE